MGFSRGLLVDGQPEAEPADLVVRCGGNRRTTGGRPTVIDGRPTGGCGKGGGQRQWPVTWTRWAMSTTGPAQ